MMKRHKLTPRSPAEPHRASTQLELFFDLVAVIAISTVTSQFHHAIIEGHGSAAIFNFVFMFLSIWWVWMNFTWYSTAYDNDDAPHRFLTLVMIFGYLIFAAGADYIFKTFDFKYGLLGWTIMRLSLVIMWMRVVYYHKENAAQAWRYIFGYIILQSLWAGVYFLTPTVSQKAFFTIISVIFLGELFLPYFATRKGVPLWHRTHIIERYGLLNIIVLGEILLSIASLLSIIYGNGINLMLMLSAVSATIVVFSFWWIYFIEEDHIEEGTGELVFFWGYGHALVFGAGALLGVGVDTLASELTGEIHAAAGTGEFCINIAAMIYFGGLWLIRDAHKPRYGILRHLLFIAAVVFLILAVSHSSIYFTALASIATLAARKRISQVYKENQS